MKYMNVKLYKLHLDVCLGCKWVNEFQGVNFCKIPSGSKPRIFDIIYGAYHDKYNSGMENNIPTTGPNKKKHKLTDKLNKI